MLLDVVDLRRLVASDEKVLVAVSGGADSVALLTEWTRLEAGQRSRLVVGHFDHRLRPESADDAAWVKRLASRLGLSCEVGVAETPPTARNGSIEAAARNARYAFLAEAAGRVGASCVATAHTQDDQVETILFNILRGSGLRGVGGMKSTRELTSGVRLIRPLLNRSRVDVRATLAASGQDWREDASNDQLHFARNRIRKVLLPLLVEEFNPKVAEALVRLGTHAAEAVDFIENAAADLLQRSRLGTDDGVIELRAETLAQAPAIVRQAALRFVYVERGWPLVRMGAQEWRSLSRLVESPDRAVDLPDGVRARIRAGVLRMERVSPTPEP